MNLTSDQFKWNDITVVLGGRPLFGLRGIEVEFGYEHEEIRASGAKAHSIAEKTFAVSGMVKVLQSEFENFVRSFGADYQRQYFDIVWNFTTLDNAQVNTHVVKRAKFGKSKITFNQGDAFTEIEMPFMALDVKLNE